MAQVQLRANSRNNAVYDLPRVCMRCGAPATAVKKRQFSWYSPWLLLLLPAGVLPFVIIAMVLTKTKTVKMPLCDQHMNSRRIRVIVGVCGLVGVFGIGAVAWIVGVHVAGKINDAIGFLCLAWLVLLLVYIVAMRVWGLSSIRPTEITDREITLTNVAQEFVNAVEDEDATYDRSVERDGRARRRKTRRRDRYSDADSYERGDDRPPRRSTDITEGEGE